MISFTSRVPFTRRLSCLLIHSRKPQPGSSFNTSICVSQATLVTDSRLSLESEYRNPFARHRLGDSQPRTSKIPLAHTCATSCCGKVTGSDSVGSCASGSACASDAVSFASFPFRYYLQPLLSILLHGTTEPALWVSLTDHIPRSSVGQASDVGFAAARVLLAPQRWTLFQHSR